MAYRDRLLLRGAEPLRHVVTPSAKERTPERLAARRTSTRDHHGGRRAARRCREAARREPSSRRRPSALRRPLESTAGGGSGLSHPSNAHTPVVAVRNHRGVLVLLGHRPSVAQHDTTPGTGHLPSAEHAENTLRRLIVHPAVQGGDPAVTPTRCVVPARATIPSHDCRTRGMDCATGITAERVSANPPGDEAPVSDAPPFDWPPCHRLSGTGRTSDAPQGST